MTSTHFGTGNKTYRSLIGNGLTYTVPAFQRNYSWEEDQWDDLWQDILKALEDGIDHYMGYLVLQTTDSKHHLIVDGQQRMTTMALFVLALMKNLRELVDTGVDAANNAQRLELLRATYIGYLDPVTLVAQSKLKLNRHNDYFFQNYLVPLLPGPKRGQRESVKRLQQGFDWWDKKIKAHAKRGLSGGELAAMVDTASDKLFFTVITVSSELNAFTVFETLNARGVRLSPTDLLKNYLFSKVSPHGSSGNEAEVEQLEERWEKIVTSLGEENFTSFLRVHWNSRNELTREAELFKVLRGRIPDRGAVFSLMRAMEGDLEIYLDLLDAKPTVPEQGKALEQLKLFGIRQMLSLLLAAKHRMTDADFAATLRAAAVLIFRYSVIGSQANNDLERACSQAVQAILKATTPVTLATILPSLREVYRPDALFVADFKEKTFKTSQKRNKSLVRHILFALERQSGGALLDEESNEYNIEHVLPENPDAAVAGFSDQAFAEHVHRLGNLTLMNASANRDLGNAPFDQKKAVYAQSAFALTRKIAAENEEWTPDRIQRRQKWMADQAKTIWRISQFS